MEPKIPQKIFRRKFRYYCFCYCLPRRSAYEKRKIQILIKVILKYNSYKFVVLAQKYRFVFIQDYNELFFTLFFIEKNPKEKSSPEKYLFFLVMLARKSIIKLLLIMKDPTNACEQSFLLVSFENF